MASPSPGNVWRGAAAAKWSWSWAVGDGSPIHSLRKVAEGTVAMATGLQEER